MLEVILASLALAFGASIALNIYQSTVLGRLKKQVSDRDDLIDDLRGAISGIPPERDAWKHETL